MTTISSERLDLVWLSPELLDALLAGRREEAEQLGAFTISPEWPDDHDRRFLRYRLRQIATDPEHGSWLARAIVVREPPRVMVGHIGFHGKPGVNAAKRAGGVELGYTVFEPYRRRGYAEEAIRSLMRWARETHGIDTFIASVSPDNGASLALVRKLGFVEIGSHWDEEDGEELEFELTAA